MKRSLKVSFETTDYSEKTDEMDKETENESSEGKQPELPVHDEDDVLTLMLKVPSWTEANDDPEEFDNLLYEIPSWTDSDVNVDEDISDAKKWFVELGNNRNYIKALINYDVNDNWPRAIKSKEDFERAEQPRRFKWIINYDNINYIRSFLSPEILERILKEDLLKRKETCTSHRYREMLMD
ncbi:hypothetical protein AVEN_49237-2 [Araneus ventricosus]|nr:hypothetical protein AVEN_49237-2 [Araneus ventricosus]